MLPVVLVGLEAKPEDGQIRLPKLDSRYPAPVPGPTGTTLALQLPFIEVSESMGNHDSNIVDAGSVD